MLLLLEASRPCLTILTLPPMEKLSFFDYWKRCVTKDYANFSGRARRSEYWGFMLCFLPVSFVLYFLARLTDSSIFSILYSIWALALLLPQLGVNVRRLHDIGKSGWYILVGLIPLVGAIILLVWACQDSQFGDNQYGPSPKFPEGV